VSLAIAQVAELVPSSVERRRIALGIVSLFAGGGLQRDCAAIARLLQARGHSVTLFTSRIRGALTIDVPISLLPNERRTNHGRNAAFAEKFAQATRGKFDLVVGFDKLSGLDILYCADPPTYWSRSWFARLRPRYRTFARLEGACFARRSATRVILLSGEQAANYQRIWETQSERVAVIGPGIDRSRARSDLRQAGKRAAIRRALGLREDELVVLCVGGQPATKGHDRVMQALVHFPSARLVLVGLDAASSKWAPLQKLADRLGIASRVLLLGTREDVPELMAASDVLVHLARQDTTGNVILEAVVNGLPVIVTAACGFSSHVRAAAAGVVLPQRA